MQSKQLSRDIKTVCVFGDIRKERLSSDISSRCGMQDALITGRPGFVREARILLDVKCYAAGVQGGNDYDLGCWEQVSNCRYKNCTEPSDHVFEWEMPKQKYCI